MASAWERLKVKRRPDGDDAAGSDGVAAPADAASPDDGSSSPPVAPPSAGQTRQPTAEELRAAFTRKRDDEPEQRRSDFQEQYSTESLFFTTGDDDLDFERRFDDAAGDRPSDYYYDPDDPWAALGIPPDSPWEDVVAAHRRLAKANHPDTITGGPDELARAEERIREINVAYALLRKRLGR